MDDGEQQRLARLKDDERRRSARQSAMRRMLSQDDAALEDKVAAVKTVQKGRQDARRLGNQHHAGARQKILKP